MTTQRSITLLGSTGSIGTQAIQVVQANPDLFAVTAISAAGSDPALLAQQAVDLAVADVAVACDDQETLTALRSEIDRAAAAAGKSGWRPAITAGADAVVALAGAGTDVVLNGMTGSIGLRPTLAALASGATVALANKESLIVGGPLVRAAAAPGQIVPVDSEHSAIAQCLRAGRAEEVRRLVLTASGGPFRGWTRAELAHVTPAEALKHPNFAMGKVITTNSATLVNKGLEVIEAQLLFGVSFDDIDVVIHPQQQIHSMVEFHDGSTIAQMGPPRMLVPIALGLSWPDRMVDVDSPCDWSAASTWQFEPLDNEAFPAVQLALQVGRLGGTAPAIYNAANEEAVEAFHAGGLSFTGIVDLVSRVVEDRGRAQDDGAIPGPSDALDIDGVLTADAWARARARDLLAT